ILNKDDFVEAYFNLGEVFRRLGRHPEALESYRRCLQLGMSHPRLYLQISRVHAIQGETEEALKWLRRVPLPRAADRRNLSEQMPELEPILELLESSN
ncbi:MAG: tetratricopeptide repeat protein, partial [Acidobacteriota bacterium]